MVRISFTVSDGIIPFFYLGIRTGKRIKVFSFKKKEEFVCALFFLIKKYRVPARAVTLKDLTKIKSILTSSSFKKAKERAKGLSLLRFVSQKSFVSSEDKEAYDSISGAPIVPVEVSFLLKSLLLSPLPSLKEEELELITVLLKDCQKPKGYFVRNFSVKKGKLEELTTSTTSTSEETDVETAETEEEKKLEENELETLEERSEKRISKEKGEDETEKIERKESERETEKEIERIENISGKEEEEEEEEEQEEKNQDKPLPSVRFSKLLTESFLKCSVKVSPIVSLWEVLLFDEEERELFSFLSSFFPKKQAFNVVALHGERQLKKWIDSGFFSFAEELEKRKGLLTRLKKRRKTVLEKEREEKEIERKTKEEQAEKGEKDFFRRIFPFFKKKKKTVNNLQEVKETKKAEVRKENKREKFLLGQRVKEKNLKDFFCKVLEKRIKSFKKEGKRKATYVLHTICASLDCPCSEEEEDLLTLINFLNYSERLNKVLESILGDTSLGNFMVNEPLRVKEVLLSLSEKREFLELFKERYRESLNLWNSFLESAVKFSEVKGEKASAEFFRKIRDSSPVVGELTLSDLLFSRRGRGRSN